MRFFQAMFLGLFLLSRAEGREEFHVKGPFDLDKNKFVLAKIKENFDLSPRGIREMLNLNKPIYEKTSAYGHFGRAPEENGSFSWEKTNKINVFSK